MRVLRGIACATLLLRVVPAEPDSGQRPVACSHVRDAPQRIYLEICAGYLTLEGIDESFRAGISVAWARGSQAGVSILVASGEDTDPGVPGSLALLEGEWLYPLVRGAVNVNAEGTFGWASWARPRLGGSVAASVGIQLSRSFLAEKGIARSGVRLRALSPPSDGLTPIATAELFVSVQRRFWFLPRLGQLRPALRTSD